MAKWIQFEIKELVLETLNKKNMKKLDFFDFDYLRQKIIVPHLTNVTNNHKKIWNMFVLVNWLNKNIS